MILTGALLLSLLLSVEPRDPHNIHISYGRLAVEDNVAILRARYFEHDLLLSISEAFPSEDVGWDGPGASRSDSLLSQYLNSHIVFAADGDTLTGSLARRSSDGELIWVDLAYASPDTLKRISIRNESLFEQFDDQKNIWQVSHFPTGIRHTLYFIHGSSTYSLDLVSSQ